MKLSMFALGFGTLTLALSLNACSKKSDDASSTTSTTGAAADNKGGDKGGEKLRGSCTRADRCTEDTEKSDPIELAKSFCEGMQGKWADKAPCGTDKRVASCTAKSGATTYYFDTGADSLDNAKFHCETILEAKLVTLAQPAAAAKTVAAGGAAGGNNGAPAANAGAAKKPAAPAAKK